MLIHDMIAKLMSLNSTRGECMSCDIEMKNVFINLLMNKFFNVLVNNFIIVLNRKEAAKN